MSDEAPTVADQGRYLLGDNGTSFDGMTDEDIRRHVVNELLLPAVNVSDTYVNAAFDTLIDGDDLRFVQDRYRERQRLLAELARAEPKGSA